MNINYKESFFNSADGKKIKLHEYHPNSKSTLSIILIYEIFGKTSHIHNYAIKLAKEGILVYIPDIFSRLEDEVILPYNKEGFKKGIKLKEDLGWQLPVMDIVSCASLLRQQYSVCVMGFCYGGSLSWIASQKSFIFDKTVCFYGSNIPDFLIKNINSPSVLHFGEKDKGIPKAAIDKVKEYKSKQEQIIKIFEYKDADHGFNCEDRSSYHANSAKLSFTRSLNFIKGIE